MNIHSPSWPRWDDFCSLAAIGEWIAGSRGLAAERPSNTRKRKRVLFESSVAGFKTDITVLFYLFRGFVLLGEQAPTHTDRDLCSAK